LRLRESGLWQVRLALRKTQIVVALPIAICCATTPAYAHDFGSLAPFWVGVLHVAVSPLSIGTILGLAGSLCVARASHGIEGLAIATVAAFLAAWLATPIAAWASAGAIFVGLSAASGLKPNALMAVSIGLFGGAAAGCAASVDAPTIVTALGVGFGVFWMACFAYEGFHRLEALLPLARRVIGAWVAAIGLLLAALALKG